MLQYKTFKPIWIMTVRKRHYTQYNNQ